MSASRDSRRETLRVRDDEAMQIMDDLVDALDEGIEINRRVAARVAEVRDMRRDGLHWSQIAKREPRPLIVEMLTESLQRQADAGARFRKAAARVLYCEGTSMDEIAGLFGVTRQRVSTLINAPLTDEAGREASPYPSS